MDQFVFKVKGITPSSRAGLFLSSGLPVKTVMAWWVGLDAEW